MANNMSFLVKVDNEDRIHIPIRVMRALDIKKRECLELAADSDKKSFTVKKSLPPQCVICGSKENLKKLTSNNHICESCARKLNY